MNTTSVNKLSSKCEVNYIKSSIVCQCRNCGWFVPLNNCTVVKGTINALGTCDRWKDKNAD